MTKADVVGYDDAGCAIVHPRTPHPATPQRVTRQNIVGACACAHPNIDATSNSRPVLNYHDNTQHLATRWTRSRRRGGRPRLPSRFQSSRQIVNTLLPAHLSCPQHTQVFRDSTRLYFPKHAPRARDQSEGMGPISLHSIVLFPFRTHTPQLLRAARKHSVIS